MDQAFVENSQHDINCHQCGEDEEGSIRQRLLKRLEGAGKTSMNPSRQSNLLLHLLNRLDRITQRHAGRQIERQRHRRKLPLMIHRDGRSRWFVMRDGAQGHDRAIGRARRAVGRAQVNRVQAFGALPELGIDFHHDVVLVQQSEHR